MLLSAFEGDKIGLGGTGDLFQLGFPQMITVYLQVNTRDGDYSITGRFRTFFCILSLSIKYLSSHEQPPLKSVFLILEHWNARKERRESFLVCRYVTVYGAVCEKARRASLLIVVSMSRSSVSISPEPREIFHHNKMNIQHYLISIDDTDNLESPGSGTTAEKLAVALRARGLADCGQITRHQLLLHDDIPYTSGNSAMCFAACSKGDIFVDILDFSLNFLQKEAADGSDPGLCMVRHDSQLNTEPLITFGLAAKKTLVNKQAAVDLAKALHLHLLELGGSGGGIIGALAAIGLRLSGNDGRFRGWYRLGRAGEVMTVARLCSYPFIDAVTTVDGKRIEDDVPVFLAEDIIKTVLLNGLQVAPVTSVAMNGEGIRWSTLTKKEIKCF